MQSAEREVASRNGEPRSPAGRPARRSLPRIRFTFPGNP